MTFVFEMTRSGELKCSSEIGGEHIIDAGSAPMEELAADYIREVLSGRNKKQLDNQEKELFCSEEGIDAEELKQRVVSAYRDELAEHFGMDKYDVEL